MNGRGDWIRTNDPLLPKQVRYQTALRPDPFVLRFECRTRELHLWERWSRSTASVPGFQSLTDFYPYISASLRNAHAAHPVSWLRPSLPAQSLGFILKEMDLCLQLALCCRPAAFCARRPCEPRACRP